MSILRQIDKKKGEAHITEIMYKVFVSHYQLKRYMAQLIDHGIILEGAKRNYILTPKGEKLLGIYEEMHSLIPMLDDPSETNKYFK